MEPNIDRMIQKGPCKRCDDVDYPLSTSGPDFCPACAMGDDIGRIKLYRQQLKDMSERAEVKKMAFVIKDSNFPFFECIAKERRNEAYFDIAQALSRYIRGEK